VFNVGVNVLLKFGRSYQSLYINQTKIFFLLIMRHFGT
jgi:hypothetical protein